MEGVRGVLYSPRSMDTQVGRGLPHHTHPALADLLDQAVVEQLLSSLDGHLANPSSN